jgi:N-methylhydantoinase A
VTVALPTGLFASRDAAGVKRAFDEVHKVRYGTSAPEEPAELVSVRITVTGHMQKPALAALEATAADEAAPARRKPVYFRSHGHVDTPVYRRDALLAGHCIAGPALIEEHASTTVLWPGDSLVVDGLGNLDITAGAAA